MKDEEFAQSYEAVSREYAKQRELKREWAEARIEVQTKKIAECHKSDEQDSTAGGYITIAQILDKQGRDWAGALATRSMIAELLMRASRG